MTIPTNDTSKVVGQLRALLQLTQSEAQVARTRMAQARTDAVRRELSQNADNAEKRSREITEQLRALGGAPDVLAPVLGRFTAIAKSGIEQAQPFSEAILGDLALEHQLLDRSHYLKVLAEAANLASVKRLAERLEVAHSATVEWLTVVLAEEALGGPAALRATPLQSVASSAARLANLPSRWTTEQVNRTVESVQRTASEARSKAEQVAGKAEQLRSAVTEVFVASRDAGLSRAEKVARREGETEVARTVHETRRETGTLSANQLPIKGYESMTGQQVIEAVKGLKKATDIRTVIAFEEAHKARTSVVSAAQAQLARIAKDALGV